MAAEREVEIWGPPLIPAFVGHGRHPAEIPFKLLNRLINFRSSITKDINTLGSDCNKYLYYLIIKNYFDMHFKNVFDNNFMKYC